jgi:TolB protein
MRRLLLHCSCLFFAVSFLFAFEVDIDGQNTARSAVPEARYAIAFTSFAPLNTDIFIAAADGSDARPLLSGPDLDYNASFSTDGQWIVFTSTRNGSADIYRAHADGSGLVQLTNNPAFDDQGALSPDGRVLAFVSSRSGEADIWMVDVATGTLRNLTSAPGGDFRPAWSPDGQWIAFSSDRDLKQPRGRIGRAHFTDLYVIGVDGSGLRRITRSVDGVAGSPAWSRDGKRLLYYEASSQNIREIGSVRRGGGATQLASIDVATGARQVLTTGPREKWSPREVEDGRIGFASGGSDEGLDFVTGASGARGETRSPNWASDGRRMVFHRDVGTQAPPLRDWPSLDPTFRLVRTGVFPSATAAGDRLVMNDQTAANLHSGIMVMNIDGSRRSLLFNDPDPAHSALAPVWSPQDDRIAFGLGRFFQTPDRPSTADIAIINADGTGVQMLTDGKGNYGFPSWSPDGRRLVIRVGDTVSSRLAILDVASRQVTYLTTSATANENFPSWSPKGDRIAFTSDRDGDFEIYSMRIDGTDVKRLTNTPGNDAHSAWSPDGLWIAFTSERGNFKDETALHPFQSQTYGDLYVMRADGTDVRRLTDDQFEDGTPSWIPLTRSR